MSRTHVSKSSHWTPPSVSRKSSSSFKPPTVGIQPATGRWQSTEETAGWQKPLASEVGKSYLSNSIQAKCDTCEGKDNEMPLMEKVETESAKNQDKVSKYQAKRINREIAKIRKLVSKEYIEDQFSTLEGDLNKIIGECFKRHGHLITFALFAASRTCGENGLLTVDCYLALGGLAGALIVYFWCINDKYYNQEARSEVIKQYMDDILRSIEVLENIQSQLEPD